MKANQNIQKKEVNELKGSSSFDTTKTEDENVCLRFCSIVDERNSVLNFIIR